MMIEERYERLNGLASPGPDVAVEVRRQGDDERLRLSFRDGTMLLNEPGGEHGFDLIIDLGDRPWHTIFGTRMDDLEPNDLGGVAITLPDTPNVFVSLPPFDAEPLPHPDVLHGDVRVMTVAVGAPGGNHQIWERYERGRVVERGSGAPPWEPDLSLMVPFAHMLAHQLGDIDLWGLFSVSQFNGREALADMIGGIVADRPNHPAQTDVRLIRPLASLCFHLAHNDHRTQISTRANRIGAGS